MSSPSRPLSTCLFLLLAVSLLVTTASAQRAARKGSPFEGLRWKDGTPEVRVRGEWFVPESIHGVAVSEILAFCNKRWPGQVQKRFGEDLVEAMTLMGHTVPQHVDLELLRSAGGERVEIKRVAVTRANRQAIRDGRPAPSASLARGPAKEDLQALATRLKDQFAYLDLGGFDWKQELEEIRKTLPERVSVADLASRLQRFMAHFRDGHLRVSSDLLPRPTRYPPFLLQDADGGVVAFRPDRSGFLDPKHPYVIELDGVGIDAWCERARPTIASGSPQLVRHRALRALRGIELLRRPADGAKPGTMRVKLSAGAGSVPVEREFRMSPRRPTYGAWPRSRTRVLDGNVGYLRLPAMDDNLVPGLRRAMTSFRKTRGLIVDVRGNGGGSRSLLIALAGYLVGPSDGPWVGNVAKYVLSSRFGSDHLEARYMRIASDRRWSDAQRKAISVLSSRFKPEWNPPGKFSDWHYLVLGRTGHDREYFYDKPVVVLCDASCFSATDIFLGALIGRPRVTLMGEPSGGGSARSQRFTLPNSGIRIQCASMASFRPDGRLYDGRGVEVDVKLAIKPTDLINNGTDSVLTAALARIRRDK